jgi:hypothetical protein
MRVPAVSAIRSGDRGRGGCGVWFSNLVRVQFHGMHPICVECPASLLCRLVRRELRWILMQV